MTGADSKISGVAEDGDVLSPGETGLRGSGRIEDIVNRGGERLSAREVEDTIAPPRFGKVKKRELVELL